MAQASCQYIEIGTMDRRNLATATQTASSSLLANQETLYLPRPRAFGNPGDDDDDDDDNDVFATPASRSAPCGADRCVEWKRRLKAHVASCGVWWALAAGLIAAVVVFWPWYALALAPRFALVERIESGPCHVLNHTVAARRSDHVRIAPGLLVRFAVDSVHVDKRQSDTLGVTDTDDPHLVLGTESKRTKQRVGSDTGLGRWVTGVALPRLLLEQSWMGAADAERFWRAYPIGAVTTCFYDSDAPTAYLAVRDGIDRLGLGLMVCILVTLFVFVLTSAIVVVPIHAWAGIGRFSFA